MRYGEVQKDIILGAGRERRPLAYRRWLSRYAMRVLGVSLESSNLNPYDGWASKVHESDVMVNMLPSSPCEAKLQPCDHAVFIFWQAGDRR